MNLFSTECERCNRLRQTIIEYACVVALGVFIAYKACDYLAR